MSRMSSGEAGTIFWLGNHHLGPLRRSTNQAENRKIRVSFDRLLFFYLARAL
jgi:hypothetical protein